MHQFDLYMLINGSHEDYDRNKDKNKIGQTVQKSPKLIQVLHPSKIYDTIKY